MKKILIFVAVLFCLSGIASAQSKSKAPEAVNNAFKSKFPNAQGVKWDKEGKNAYEAEFTMNSKKCSANFSDKGEWMETEASVGISGLPANVKSAFTAKHKDAKIKDVMLIETPKGKKYEIEYKAGIKSKEAYFDENGTEVKK